MITNYKIFETLNSRGTKSLTEKEFDQILKSNCKNWSRSKTPLYRGQINLGAYLYTDPRGTYRKSIDDVNTHIEMMDNLPSWEGYPKYSQSVIGVSSNKSMAEDYISDNGVVYEIIPFDNIEIAVCPSMTIWDSFGGFGDEDAIYLTGNFFEENGINRDIWVQPEGDSIEDRLKSLDKISNGKYSKEFLYQASDFLKKKPSKINGVDCYNFINDYLFNPDVCGFNKVRYVSGFEIEKNKQIWTNGPVLLIHQDLV